ncbi:DNA helicase [Tanacetum coccineum]
MKVEAAMAQIEAVGASEKEALKRSEATQKEIDELKDSTEAALKRAHMVESAQKSAALILQETDIKNSLQLSSTSATHYYLDPNIPETYHIKQQHGQLTDTTSFLNVNNQRYEDPDQERTRNHFPLATLLEVNPQNYQRVRFTSEATIYKINTQREWYYQKCMRCGKKVITEVLIPKCKSHGPQATTLYSFWPKIADKNPFHLPPSLKELKGTTHTFQFHFDSGITLRRPDFVLDTVFLNPALPMLALPPQNLPHSPPTAVDPLVTKNVEPSSPAPHPMEPNVPTPTEIHTTPPSHQHQAKTQKILRKMNRNTHLTRRILFPDEPEAKSSEVTKKMKHEG